ncbi:MAG: nucleotidyltransferase family protein [Gemmatimonadales bacterium]
MPDARGRPRIAAVVLAAGGSTRFGSPKQLYMHEGEPLARRAVMSAIAAGADPVVVVLGASADEITPTLAGLSSVTVVNDEWETGLASSLVTGLQTVARMETVDGALITLVDQPLVDAGALARLIASFDAKHRIVAADYGDTMGVPVVIGREHFAELINLTGDRGAGAWLRSRSREVTTVPLDAASVDIDTQADASRLESDGEED